MRSMRLDILRSGLIIVVVMMFFAFSASAILAQTAKPPVSPVCMTKFGQKEWAFVIKDVPADKKQELLADKARLKAQAENMRELLALSCEAVKRGTCSGCRSTS